MAAQRTPGESGEEEYFSLDAHGFDGGADETTDDDDDDAETASMAPPRHPVPSMQGAFEESITEAKDPNPRPKSVNAETRRQRVLEVKHYDDSWTTRWRQSPGARHHPLAKLMAQIVFGMHLLQQGAAKSDAEVVRILQTHVDEVDNFLEKTTEDFDLAIKDIRERVRYLKLPMSHIDVFDTMLEDKQFRTQLLEGNDKIETIVERTSKAMNAALLDVQKGKTSTSELGQYLREVSDEWPDEKQDLEAVLIAMRGNEQGWKHCFRDLQKKGIELRDTMDQLSTLIAEMARMAAAASRRAKAQGRAAAAGQPPMSTILPRSKFSNDGQNQNQSQSQRSRAMSVDKPLPKAPSVVGGAVELEAHPVPLERRYEQPRDTSVSSERNGRGHRSSTVPPRPSSSRSAMTPREARNVSRDNTNDIIDFLKERRTASPLGSNPPEDYTRSSNRAKRASAVDVVDHARSLSSMGVRPNTSASETMTALPSGRRGSEPLRMGGPQREGISRNRHGPPPSGKGSSRRESSIGPFVRRLSFRRKQVDSPPPNHESLQQAVKSAASPARSPEPSAASDIKSPSPTDSKLKPSTESSANRTASPQQPAVTALPNQAAPTPSATVNGQPNPSAMPPKSDSTTSERKVTPSPEMRMTNGNGTAHANGGSRQSPTSGKEETPPRSRGMSLRRLFGSSKSSEKRAKPPRSAMTYGDLA